MVKALHSSRPPARPTTPQTNGPAKPPPDGPGARYKIEDGDTLSQIALKQLGSAKRWPEIAKLNGIDNPRLIQPGEVLRLPEVRSQLSEQQVANKTAKGDVQQQARVATNFADTHQATAESASKKTGTLNLLSSLNAASKETAASKEIAAKTAEAKKAESYLGLMAEHETDAPSASTHKAVNDFMTGFAEGAVDTAKGLMDMGEGAWNMAGLSGKEAAKQSWSNLGDTLSYVKNNPKSVVKALAEPYKKAWQEGSPGKAIGRGTFEAVSMVIGGKGLGKIAKLAKGARGGKLAASVTDDAARLATKVGDDMGSLGSRLGGKIDDLEQQLSRARVKDLKLNKTSTETVELAHQRAEAMADELSKMKIDTAVKQGDVGTPRNLAANKEIDAMAQRLESASAEADRLAQLRIDEMAEALDGAKISAGVEHNIIGTKGHRRAMASIEGMEDELSKARITHGVRRHAAP